MTPVSVEFKVAHNSGIKFLKSKRICLIMKDKIIHNEYLCPKTEDIHAYLGSWEGGYDSKNE